MSHFLSNTKTSPFRTVQTQTKEEENEEDYGAGSDPVTNIRTSSRVQEIQLEDP